MLMFYLKKLRLKKLRHANGASLEVKNDAA
jgi:hypothetical protein